MPGRRPNIREGVLLREWGSAHLHELRRRMPEEGQLGVAEPVGEVGKERVCPPSTLTGEFMNERSSGASVAGIHGVPFDFSHE